MSKSILGLLIALLFATSARADQPTFNITSIDADPGEIIEINFNVNNFTDLILAQFSVNWNPAVLRFRTIKNFNPAVNGLNLSVFNITPSYVDNGRFAMAWLEPGVEPISIPNGSLFYTVEFEVIGDPCQSSLVAITNDPLEIEVTEEDEVNLGLISNNGLVTIPGVGCSEGIDLIGNTVVAACDSEACVQFTVQNFVNVGGMEFSLAFNPSVLQFDRFQNYAPLPGFGNGSTNQFPVGNLRVIWTNPNVENSSLPDGTTLFEICFDVVGTGGQSSTITLGNDPPVMFFDSDLNPHVVNFQPASITADCGLEGFALIASDTCVNPGGIACIDISVNDFDDILAMQFSLNWDSTVFRFHHLEGLNLAGLNESIGTPPNPGLTAGELTVSWVDPDFIGVTLPDLTTIFTVCLEAVGPVGSSSAITFSNIPNDIEILNADDSLLVYGTINGVAQILVNCDIPPCTIDYTLVVTNPTCPGLSNGSINLTVNTGGCPDPPTYLWSNGAPTQDISGVPAGTYSVTITVGPQVVIATDMIVNPTSMGATASITNPVPAGSATGAINLTVSGGMPPYTFMWNNGPLTEDISNLLAGTYIVTITDSKGCIFIPDPFVVGADISGAVTNVACFGSCTGAITVSPSFGTPPYTYLWNTTPPQTTPTINNLCAGSYCVTITDATGSTRDTCFTVSQSGLPLNVTANITHDIDDIGEGAIDLNVTGGTPPYFYLWSTGAISQDITDLDAGQYCVTITHGQNCTYDTCFNVFAGGIGVNLVVTQYGNFQTSCANICDGEIISQVSGGLAPITYQWSNGSTQPNLVNLCAGVYSVTVTDASGNSTIATTTITSPPPLTFTEIITKPSDFTTFDGAISIIASGGVPNYEYRWIGGNTASANNLPFGIYSITIIDDNGCEFTKPVELLPDNGECYEANTIITPNSDGKNDFFIITCINDADNHLYIFNRGGGLVYDTPDYLNNWTGVDNDNQPLPDGGYLWVLEVDRPGGVTEILKGTVNVLRTAD